MKTIVFFYLNRPEKAHNLTPHQRRCYDAISHFSMSYLTKEATLKARVSENGAALPTPNIVSRKRVTGKTDHDAPAPQTNAEDGVPNDG